MTRAKPTTLDLGSVSTGTLRAERGKGSARTATEAWQWLGDGSVRH